MIGTIKEKKIRKIGINFRYIYSQLNKTINKPYYTAFIITSTFYNNPIITIGFNRNILSSSINNDIKLNKFDIITNVFQSASNNNKNYDIIAYYFMIDFPNSSLKIFFELGYTDKWKNLNDFLIYPDNNIGSLFGIRQYEAFNNEHLIVGFEYARLLESSFWKNRPTLNWYDNPLFDYSSYDGRRWAAHSGSDSDDLYIYFGYINDTFSFIPSLNYERHGITYARPPEVKMEMRIDIRYIWKDYKLNIYFEREWMEHAGFVPNKWRNSTVIWFGIERDLTSLLSNKLGFINN